MLGRNIVFSCRGSACISVMIMSRQRFRCCGRDGHDKLHPSCCNMFGLGKDFSIVIEYFCVTTKFGQGQEFLCHDRIFLYRGRVWPWARILCYDKVFLCRDQGLKNHFFWANFSAKNRFSVGLETILGRKIKSKKIEKNRRFF